MLMFLPTVVFSFPARSLSSAFSNTQDDFANAFKMESSSRIMTFYLVYWCLRAPRCPMVPSKEGNGDKLLWPLSPQQLRRGGHAKSMDFRYLQIQDYWRRGFQTSIYRWALLHFFLSNIPSRTSLAFASFHLHAHTPPRISYGSMMFKKIFATLDCPSTRVTIYVFIFTKISEILKLCPFFLLCYACAHESTILTHTVAHRWMKKKSRWGQNMHSSPWESQVPWKVTHSPSFDRGYYYLFILFWIVISTLAALFTYHLADLTLWRRRMNEWTWKERKIRVCDD